MLKYWSNVTYVYSFKHHISFGDQIKKLLFLCWGLSLDGMDWAQNWKFCQRKGPYIDSLYLCKYFDFFNCLWNSIIQVVAEIFDRHFVLDNWHVNFNPTSKMWLKKGEFVIFWKISFFLIFELESGLTLSCNKEKISEVSRDGYKRAARTNNVVSRLNDI